MPTVVREPAVAGRFYPGKADVLLRDIRSYTQVHGEKIPAIGCLVPHAGYMYSGHVAGAVFGRLELPRRYLILCPNHTGMGHPLAIMSEGAWRTPLGEAPIDAPLAAALMEKFSLLGEDADAHRYEHALEVQLPFLQSSAPGFIFVPIAVGTGRYDVLSALGAALAEAVSAQQDRILIVASSDMNHYETDSITREKDAKAIERIVALDPVGLYEVITTQKISMCGYGPAIAMLVAATRLGAQSAQLIKYATSADTSGDRSAVVGYAGIAVTA
jgi:AmmeMemoRadiSam system protein B